MTKKKKPTTARGGKTLKYPAAVIAAQQDLQKKNHKLSGLMRKLTESEDLYLQGALPKMWFSLEKAEKKTTQVAGTNTTDHLWPQFFLGMVSACSMMPSYYYQTQAQRKKLINNLKSIQTRS